MLRRTGRGINSAVFAFIFGLVCLSRSYFPGCSGLILSKSKITMCVKDSKTDPMNVVAGKKCEKKLVITKAVTTGQVASDMLYVNISKVQDEVDRDQARLYNPFIITITKSPLQLIYPYHLEGTVNNKPYETSKRQYWCQDGAETEDDSDFSCPVHYDKATGERIWDSQGFCCRCSYEEDLESGGESRYHRGDTVCGNVLNVPFLSLLFKNKKRQSAHCMHYDKLWYNYHTIGTYKLLFKVFVKAFDLVEEEKDGITHRRLVEGGEITLSNHKKSGHGIHGRILATLNGHFVPNEQLPSLAEKYYLLIPAGGSDVVWNAHPQTRNGAEDYLLIPPRMFSIRQEMNSCDKIGVSFTAFRMQGGEDGQGSGCTSKIGTCLSNQIKDIFEDDMRRRDHGRHPLYFPERHGKLVGTSQYDKSGGFALVYAVTQVVTSMVTLEISADDIILIYNKATGIIVKAFATDFASLSRDGRLNVIVQNTGLVSADFYVTVSSCTIGVLRGLEMKAIVNPQASHVVSMALRTTVHASSKHMCTVNLLDARHEFLDSANVSFETTKSCVCLQSCSCACTGDADSNRCVLEGNTKSEDGYKFDNVRLEKRVLGTTEMFFRTLNNSLTLLVDHFAKPTFGRVLNVWLFFSLLFGFFKARLGIVAGGGPIAYFGWWWETPEGEEFVVNAKGVQVLGIYNDDGELIDPHTGEVLKSEKLLLFVGNLFFFVLFICILGVHASRHYKGLRGDNQMTVTLSSIALTCTTVYRNFTEFPDAENYFKNPGTNFSVAGKLQRIKLDYNFVVDDNMQMVEVAEDALLLLDPPLQFDGAAFTQLFNVEKALNEITLMPLYVCLNEQPTILDYYSGNEEPSEESLLHDGYSTSEESSSSPPTPPLPDYSFHEGLSAFPNDNSSVYEIPVAFS